MPWHYARWPRRSWQTMRLKAAVPHPSPKRSRLSVQGEALMRLGGKRVVVTGGAGLIGSFLVERLVTAGARVIVADDFSKGRRDHLAAVLDQIEVREGDLEALPAMQRALEGADVVFHLASRAYGVGY
ncbi:MAG: NAD-dependent epimerase/dehydratase family protein, partial [Acidobacteria bacterium]